MDDYDIDLSYYSDYAECSRCPNPVYGLPWDHKGPILCSDCRDEERGLDQLEYDDPHASRRDAHRERGRRGMVKHSEPNVRPMKLPKPKVSVR